MACDVLPVAIFSNKKPFLLNDGFPKDKKLCHDFHCYFVGLEKNAVWLFLILTMIRKEGPGRLFVLSPYKPLGYVNKKLMSENNIFSTFLAAKAASDPPWSPTWISGHGFRSRPSQTTSHWMEEVMAWKTTMLCTLPQTIQSTTTTLERDREGEEEEGLIWGTSSRWIDL